jgi:antitoxin component YwqK of YwqJK toxin-antitoxin module
MNIYFNNFYLLQNTLLPYFNNPDPLNNLNKRFSQLNYEKYNTHLQPHGIVETYYPATKTIKDRKTYRNGKLNIYQHWDINNGLSEKKTYENDKPHGPYELFYPYGKLWEKGYHKNNKRDGSFKIWLPNGKLYKSMNYKEGKLNGLYEVYDENANTKEQHYYINGILQKT